MCDVATRGTSYRAKYALSIEEEVQRRPNLLVEAGSENPSEKRYRCQHGVYRMIGSGQEKRVAHLTWMAFIYIHDVLCPAP